MELPVQTDTEPSTEPRPTEPQPVEPELEIPGPILILFPVLIVLLILALWRRLRYE